MGSCGGCFWTGNAFIDILCFFLDDIPHEAKSEQSYDKGYQDEDHDIGIFSGVHFLCYLKGGDELVIYLNYFSLPPVFFGGGVSVHDALQATDPDAVQVFPGIEPVIIGFPSLSLPHFMHSSLVMWHAGVPGVSLQ